MGIGHETGRLAPGMSADLMVVEGDPLTQIEALGRVLAVVTGGRPAIAPTLGSDRREGAIWNT